MVLADAARDESLDLQDRQREDNDRDGLMRQGEIDRHYAEGPPAGWESSYISSYATMHPFEDFAETWAHYLHICDSIETASEYGLTTVGTITSFTSFRDVVVLKIVKRFLDTGVALQNIRAAVQHLRARGFHDLERMTLMCDGATVHECSSPDEVVELLQCGQGVFGIAVGVVWQDVHGALSQLHGERVDTGETLVGHNPADELARRRRDRAV